eukprot:tig00021434_g21346.t1
MSGHGLGGDAVGAATYKAVSTVLKPVDWLLEKSGAYGLAKQAMSKVSQGANGFARKHCLGSYAKVCEANCEGKFNTPACHARLGTREAEQESHWAEFCSGSASTSEDLELCRERYGSTGRPRERALDSDKFARNEEDGQAAPEDGGTVFAENGAPYRLDADAGYVSYSAEGYSGTEEASASAAEAESAEGYAFEAATDGGLAYGDCGLGALWHVYADHEPTAPF